MHPSERNESQDHNILGRCSPTIIFPPCLLPGAGSWATTEEGEREEQDGRSALADSKPSQPPPALHMQDLKHLPDGCWLLIRTVSSQRPAGKPAGSLELASRSLPSFLERVT